MRARLRPILQILTVLALVSGCGSLTPSPPANPAPAAISGSPEDRKPAGEAAAAVRQKIRQLLAADSYPAALALVLSSGLSETELAEEYGLALKGLLKKADVYREKDLPEKAGPLYRAALDGYPATPAVAAKAGTRPAGITAGIETCADQLLERGLAAYRSGDLDQAIRTWKLIHVFAPQHQASRKALQTAEVQLANLKKVRAEQ
jgi:tetratricopeptide (TPR) repeat protein